MFYGLVQLVVSLPDKCNWDLSKMAAVFDIELHDADEKTQEDSDDDNVIEVEEV